MTCKHCGLALRADNHVNGDEHATIYDCEHALMLVAHTIYAAILQLGKHLYDAHK